MPWRRMLFGTLVFIFVVGLATRWAALPYAGWVLAVSASALVFLFLPAIMGARGRQPSDAPERRVDWHD